MKQMLRKKDVWVLLAALIGAFACVTLIQFISGRIDGVASMVFLLAVFFVSMYTDGYWWGVAGSVISVLASTSRSARPTLPSTSPSRRTSSPAW